jgi:hypothetical protein
VVQLGRRRFSVMTSGMMITIKGQVAAFNVMSSRTCYLERALGMMVSSSEQDGVFW